MIGSSLESVVEHNQQKADRILLVEDDPDLRSGLTFALEKEGYEVESAAAVSQAEAADSADLVILDVMLPDGSGFALCEAIREGRTKQSALVNIIFLTAKDEETDAVRGLEIGGDDYIVKPFRLRELLSRVRARLRRRDTGDPPSTPAAGLHIDRSAMRVYKDGRPVALTVSEYRILLALYEHRGMTLSRDQLADRLIGTADAAVDDNTLSVYIRRLREKIEADASKPRYIVTVRGLGYMFPDQS